MITCGPSIYKERHDRVLYQLVRALSDNLGLKVPKQLRAPGGKIAPGVMGTSVKRLIIDQTLLTDREIFDRRPDLVVRLRIQRRVVIFEVACAWEPTITDRENQKRRKYQELGADLLHQWPSYRIEVIPVVVGDLGLITNMRRYLLNSHIFREKEISRLMSDVKREVLCSAVRIIKGITPCSGAEGRQEGGLAGVCKSLQNSKHGDKTTEVEQESRFKNIIH